MGLARTLLATFATKGLGFVLVFAAGVVLSRGLGAAGKGEIDALVGLFGLLLVLSPAIEERQYYLLTHGEARPYRLLRWNLVFALTLGLLLVGVAELLLRYFQGLFEYRDRKSGEVRPIDPGLVRTIVVAAPFALLHRFAGGLLQGLRDQRAVNRAHLLQCSTLFLGVLGSVLLGGGVFGGVLAQAFSFAAPGLLSVWQAHRRIGPDRPTDAESSSLPASLLRGGLRAQGAVFAGAVIVMADLLILHHFHGPAVVGVYALAAALAGQLRRLILQPVKEVLTSEMVGAGGDVTLRRARLSHAGRHLVLLWLPPILGFALIGGGLVRGIYGAEFAPAYALLLVLLPANLLWSWAVLFSTELILANRLITLTAIGVAVAGTNVTLNWLLIPTGSAMAAAWVSLATYGLYAGILVFWLRRNRGLGWAAWLIPTREDLRNLRIMLSGRSRKG